MSSYSSSEIKDIEVWILHCLSATPYACSSLERLPNGTTNFVFRGHLSNLPRIKGEGINKDTQIVIVKYIAENHAMNKNFLLDRSRASAEQSMLQLLQKFPPITTKDAIQFQTPNLLHFDPNSNIQVLYDFPNSIALVDLLRNPSSLLDQPTASSLGNALGHWLRAFHTWSSTYSPTLSQTLGPTLSTRHLKRQITTSTLLPLLSTHFPHLLAPHKHTLEQVCKTLSDEAEHGPGEDWHFVHGDLWSGNILLSPPPPTTLLILDWELVHLSPPSTDLGQLIGDLYERAHFNSSAAALHVLESFCTAIV
ncbi:hypothetical protein BS50DRAFT_673562 [Corynespora cassiicola Philippines]|uniref:Aminoglycoside phosphotransferase domain-containing protein n=1 Tax=Corynespora cassiicola Philippines TaxID=1448308 RepID=A0A2T2NZN0_CORCC|nr:hypothetical protein BS50DRAFT_673562 [Corynespora cassiicola Philippines]